MIMKYLFLMLSLWPACTISAQQVQSPSSKEQLVRELAKLGCRFYVGEPGGSISFNQYGRTEFRVLRDGDIDMSTIRGIQIDKRVSERIPFSDMLATSVRQQFPDIELIYLDRNPSAIQAFSSELQHLTDLRCLHVYHGDRMTGTKDIVAAVSKLEKLESLQLWDGWLTDKLAGALDGHPNMRYLVLAPMIQRDDGRRNGEAVNSLSAAMLSRVVSKMPELRYLETVRCRLEGEFQWAAFAKLRQLETIKFRWSAITGERLNGISKLDGLKHLDLLYAPITGRALIELSGLPKLEYLGIHHTNIRSGILHLEAMGDLQLGCFPRMFTQPLSEDEVALLLRFGVQGPFGDDKNNGEGQYSLLRMAENLQSVDSIVQTTSSTTLEQRRNKELGRPEKRLSLGRRLTESDFRSLKRLPGLSYLRLTQAVTSQETQYMRDFPNVQMIHLEDARIDEAWITDLASNGELDTVTIERAAIEPQAFATAKAWKSLNILQIHEVNFVAQDADRCRGIEGMPNLERLSLGGASLTDDDVTHCARIQSLEWLEWLEVHGSFTRSVIPRLAANPNLKSVGLIGLKLANIENDLLPLANSKIKYVRLNHSIESRHYGNIYSKSLANRLGITMAGECSCGCMDIEPAALNK